MNKTAAVATLDKVLHMKVGIVIAGCHGIVAVQMTCDFKVESQQDTKIGPVVAHSKIAALKSAE